MMIAHPPCTFLFQSTPPARGATSCRPHWSAPNRYFNPRPPRGGRLRIRRLCGLRGANFNPRPPRGGRRFISAGQRRNLCDFNPRPPRGGRLCSSVCSSLALSFQSTPPARGATATMSITIQDHSISIHAPREGGDSEKMRWKTTYYTFQSTPPARGATKRRHSFKPLYKHFNPRPPRGGRQQRCTVLSVNL